MATDRRRQVVLGVLLLVLGVLLYRAWTSGLPQSTSGGAATASNTRARGGRPAADAAAPATAPDVHLQALDDKRPEPEAGQRNLFRFGQRQAPPAPGGTASVVPPPPSVAGTQIAGPQGPPPIPLKFIGIVESPSQSKRIAALVDSTGRAYQGGEGDIVAGQYRVLNIGVESIEMSYLDGRGRQTIRLSGS